MTIKHLVLSGGGYLGFYQLGAVSRLLELNYLQKSNIQSIYGTSVGALFGSVLCLNEDWNTTKNYFIERPWHKIFQITPNKIFNALHDKGLFGKDTFNKILLPLIKSRDYDETMTLKQLYELSHIDLYMYTINLDEFTLVEMSHKTHPSMCLLDALYMSCALPYLFQPYYYENKYYIDGGLLNNFPVLNCVERNESHDDIFVMRFNSERKIKSIQPEHNLIEYGYFLYRTLIQNTRKKDYPIMKNELVIDCMQMNLEDGSKVVYDVVEREKYITHGERCAERYLATIERI